MSEKMCLKLGAHNSGSNPQRIYHYLKAIRPSYSVSGTTSLNNAKDTGQVYLGQTGTCYYTFTEEQEMIGFMWRDGSQTENRYLKTLSVQYSDNNSTWATLLSTSTSSHSSYERTAASQGAHKYWRVSWTGNANPSEYMCDFIGIINKEK